MPFGIERQRRTQTMHISMCVKCILFLFLCVCAQTHHGRARACNEIVLRSFGINKRQMWIHSVLALTVYFLLSFSLASFFHVQTDFMFVSLTTFDGRWNSIAKNDFIHHNACIHFHLVWAYNSSFPVINTIYARMPYCICTMYSRRDLNFSAFFSTPFNSPKCAKT